MPPKLCLVSAAAHIQKHPMLQIQNCLSLNLSPVFGALPGPDLLAALEELVEVGQQLGCQSVEL